MVILDNILSCSFIPAVGVLLPDEWLVDVMRLVRKALPPSIDSHRNQSCSIVNVVLVVNHRIFKKVGVEVENGGAPVESEVECHPPIR